MKGPDGYPEDDWLALSGIQHFSFCKRQWALIHIEQLWSENYLTTAGFLEHDRAHDYAASESRGNTLIMRDLRIFSRTLGVTGACDVVEFQRSSDGVPLHGREGLWLPYPIEYKHGKSKINDADRLQLCAEAMCLEEMLACAIPEGALFYRETKRREQVVLNDDLRFKVRELFEQMHDLMKRGWTPVVKTGKSCAACSLKDWCLPELQKTKTAREYIDEYVNDDVG
ncbi:CRISPR-associated protein Cas4 [Bifidobacterium eulemuris]|uniref:CRISPR-associated exonuclease Cas4 n=1 Tax=Bifidobacterium eulemuris TaxID=1765219 RepID=A0A261FZ27_9BIFI|nr:CRISPR-associated protein Cas4 [Bifidobacterium eulemuris]OZG64006.1 CRISPR-associated protein Cas4 [Bifidobacterium eulemuris]QOL32839.1 CRISPR-associated protein Cas4 [Bifidobacterium eulemuris]